MLMRLAGTKGSEEHGGSCETHGWRTIARLTLRKLGLVVVRRADGSAEHTQRLLEALPGMEP